MKRIFYLFTVVIFLALLMTPGLCRTGAGKNTSVPSFKVNEYKNDKLGLFVKSPDGWTLYPSERFRSQVNSLKENEIVKIKARMKELENRQDSDEYKKLKKNLDEMEASTKALQQLEKESAGQNMPLFRALKNDGKSSISISCRAMSAAMFPGFKTGIDYLMLCRNAYSVKGAPPAIKKANIGGKTFYYFEAAIAGKSGSNHYRLYSVVIKDYIIVMTCSFPADKAEELDKFLGNMSFQ